MVTAASTTRRIPQRRRRIRLVLTVLAVLFAVAAALGLAAHFWTPTSTWLLGVTAVAPVLMLGSPVALVLAGFARQWIGVAVAAALLVACVGTQAHLYRATTVPAGGRDVVVMAANVYLGQGNATSIVDAVRRHHVELLTLEEISDDQVGALSGAGLDELLPYHYAAPNRDGLGTGLWSRYPVSDGRRAQGFGLPLVSAQVTIPGVVTPVRFVAVHLSGPVPDPTGWRHDIARLPRLLKGFAGGGSVIVGGDFNATPDTVQFRHLLQDGYHDAADQAGAGLTRSWPANRWFPPLIAIDHVLTRGAVARSASTVQITGSDHRALLSTVALPRT